MTRKEKKDHLAETLNIRPSTASIAVDMLEQQKIFLALIARNEYNRGVTDVLEILEEEMINENVSFKGGTIKDRILALKGEWE